MGQEGLLEELVKLCWIFFNTDFLKDFICFLFIINLIN